jgi:hypothetical protein
MTSQVPDERRPESCSDKNGVTFDQLTAANLARVTQGVNGVPSLIAWDMQDWIIALGASYGGLLQIIKEIRSDRLGDYEAAREIGRKLADVVIYCDLTASRADLELSRCVISRFNEKSREFNSPITLMPPSLESAMAADDDVFIGDREGRVHHKNFARAACDLNLITSPTIFSSLTDARKKGLDLCAWCFKAGG